MGRVYKTPASMACQVWIALSWTEHTLLNLVLRLPPPQTGPKPPCPGEEGFGVQKPMSLRPGKGSFKLKTPIFLVFPGRGKGIFLTEDSLS